MLVVNTQSTPPRRVGGGLDDPSPPAEPRRPRRTKAVPLSRQVRRPATSPSRESTPPATAVRQPRSRRADRDTAVDAARIEPVTPAPIDEPGHHGLVPTQDEAVMELADVRAALQALVPVGDQVPTLRLIQLLAAKLAGHTHCARLINPGPHVSIDEARSRCRAWLLALDEAERHAVLSLVTADVRGASR